jgi:hypothetical protein
MFLALKGISDSGRVVIQMNAEMEGSGNLEATVQLLGEGAVPSSFFYLWGMELNGELHCIGSTLPEHEPYCLEVLWLT